jgi:hypothetical protein
MPEPQIPGQLQGIPNEGNPKQVVNAANPGYVEGPTPNMNPYAPSGNPSVNPMTTSQRPMLMSGEWRW